VQHLAALRHDKIAFISGPLDLKSAISRRDAFMQAMGEIGIEVQRSLVVEGDHTLEGGIRAMESLLSLRKHPTAVLCSNDMTALGVMHICHKKGLSIPRNLSLVGFDDIKLDQFILPPLTTVRMSQSELARIAFNALLTELGRETPSKNGTEYLLETSLVLRESTAVRD
jgi:LacI family transcriptional regulator